MPKLIIEIVGPNGATLRRVLDQLDHVELPDGTQFIRRELEAGPGEVWVSHEDITGFLGKSTTPDANAAGNLLHGLATSER